MKSFRHTSQRGLSLAVVVLILGVLAIVALVFRDQILAAFMSPPRRLQFEYYIDPNGELLEQSRYRIGILIYHQAAAPITGRIMVRMHGQGAFRFGTNNEQNAELIDDHTVVFNVSNWESGRPNNRHCIFYLTSPRLDENGLTDAQVKQRISVTMGIMFAKPDEDVNHASLSSTTIGEGSPD